MFSTRKGKLESSWPLAATLQKWSLTCFCPNTMPWLGCVLAKLDSSQTSLRDRVGSGLSKVIAQSPIRYVFPVSGWLSFQPKVLLSRGHWPNRITPLSPMKHFASWPGVEAGEGRDRGVQEGTLPRSLRLQRLCS